MLSCKELKQQSVIWVWKRCSSQNISSMERVKCNSEEIVIIYNTTVLISFLNYSAASSVGVNCIMYNTGTFS